MLFAEAAGTEALLVTLFEGASLVARLGHLARFPKPKMHPAVTLASRLAAAIFRFAGFFVRHESLLAGRVGVRLPESRQINSSTIVG
jgi:hypothetical protein